MLRLTGIFFSSPPSCARIRVIRYRFCMKSQIYLLASCLFLAAVAGAEPLPGTAMPLPASDPNVKSSMSVVYQSFKGLQKFLYSRDRFVDPANEKEIGDLMNGLRQGVHSVDASNAKYKEEPGFATTLRVLNEMLTDSRNRFMEGKKGYALWRLKTSANYCVSCHTRHEVKLDFSDSGLALDTLNSYEQGEFYLASRQFEKAKNSFLAAVLDQDLGYVRMDALRKWLLVYVRVYPDPQAAITQLNKLRPRAKFTRYEEDEIVSWLESLRRWQNEGELRVPVIAKAENLIRQGLGMNDPLLGKKGTVELLRATSYLHQILETKTPEATAQRGHALYLLGLAYSELPFFFVNELPELFLEQSIREYPGTDDAKNAFGLYQEIVTLGYTGSGGTRVPDDVQINFRELHDLAYGTPQLHGKV